LLFTRYFRASLLYPAEALKVKYGDEEYEGDFLNFLLQMYGKRDRKRETFHHIAITIRAAACLRHIRWKIINGNVVN
jgi:hypothetical protein